eukprot:2987292-Amphidinium_carterae.2
MSTHVDDCSVAGTPSFMSWISTQLTSGFGKLAEHGLPMMHVGIHYSRLEDGTIKVSQEEYLQSIQAIPISKSRSKALQSKCTTQETSQLRALVGSLLYLTITRPDIIADLATVQSAITQAHIEHLVLANRILKRARNHPKRRLLYKPLPFPLKVQVVSDASFATKRTSYAQQGVLVMLMSDVSKKNGVLHSPVHVLHSTGSRAKRILHSTSHAESLAAHVGVSIAESVAIRFTEMNNPYLNKMSLSTLIEMEEAGRFDVYIDLLSDCQDLIHLVTGLKGIPQDKNQRLVILSLREKLATGALRSFEYIYTYENPSNALTKYDPRDQALLDLLDKGIIQLTRSKMTERKRDKVEDDRAQA